MTGTPLPEFLGDFRNAMYRMTLLVALLTVLVAYLIYESRLGWGLFAVRDDETVAAGLGVPAFRYKMVALGANSFFSGLMGGVWALQIGFVGVDEVFNIRVPLFVILMSVLGGMRHWMGPVVGALIIYTLTDRLNSAGEVATPLGTINFIDVNQIIIGALLIVMVLGVREGIFLRMRERWLTSTIAFGGTMALMVAFDLSDSLVWDFAYSALVMVVPLLLPIRTYRRFRGGAGEAPDDADADADVMSEEVAR
jgi:branched-chain amino acid transport system permease protein